MKNIYLITFLIFLHLVNAQEFEKVYDHDIDRPLKSLLKGDLTNFEISPTGDYVMMLSGDYVKTIDKNGDLIFEHQCVPKSNNCIIVFRFNRWAIG